MKASSLVSSLLVVMSLSLGAGCVDRAPPSAGATTPRQAPVAPRAAPAAAAVEATPPVESPPSARPAHWGYGTGAVDGPTNWATLSPAYAACTGTSQSPINVQNRAKQPGKWKLDYKASSLRIAHHEHVDALIDNGHTIQVTVEEGSTLASEDEVYSLKQFHFHTPSEHTVDGKSFPMEAHFVHQSVSGRFAVVSVMFEEGPSNPNLVTLIDNFPPAKGDKLEIPGHKVDLAFHVPKDAELYSYVGSLTTPPCTEGVSWLIFQKPTSASPDQLAAFARRIGPNNRPVQPLGARQVSAIRLGTSAF